MICVCRELLKVCSTRVSFDLRVGFCLREGRGFVFVCKVAEWDERRSRKGGVGMTYHNYVRGKLGRRFFLTLSDNFRAGGFGHRHIPHLKV